MGEAGVGQAPHSRGFFFGGDEMKMARSVLVFLVATIVLANIATAIHQENWHSLLGWLIGFWFGVLFYLAESDALRNRVQIYGRGQIPNQQMPTEPPSDSRGHRQPPYRNPT